DLLGLVPKMMQFPLTIHYSGKKSGEEVKGIFNSNSFSTTAPDKPMIGSNAGYAIKRASYAEPTIYVLNRKDARQTHLYYYSTLPKTSLEREAAMSGFNS